MNNGIRGEFIDPQCTTITKVLETGFYSIPILGIEGESKKKNNDIRGGGGVSDPQCRTIQGFYSIPIPLLGIERETKIENNDIIIRGGGGRVSE